MANVIKSVKKLSGVFGDVIESVADGADTVVSGANNVVPELAGTGANLISGVVYISKVTNRFSSMIREISDEPEIVSLKMLINITSNKGLISVINRAMREPDSQIGSAYKLLKDSDPIAKIGLNAAERVISSFIDTDFKSIDEYQESLKKTKDQINKLGLNLVSRISKTLEG